MRPTILALVPLALLAACHRGDPSPGATTASEDRALNDAAAMLDANSMEVNAVDLNAADNAGDTDDDGDNSQ
ncbi:MAG: hypothetical protein ABIS14_03645 [Sphingomonas sp.]